MKFCFVQENYSYTSHLCLHMLNISSPSVYFAVNFLHFKIFFRATGPIQTKFDKARLYWWRKFKFNWHEYGTTMGNNSKASSKFSLINLNTLLLSQNASFSQVYHWTCLNEGNLMFNEVQLPSTRENIVDRHAAKIHWMNRLPYKHCHAQSIIKLSLLVFKFVSNILHILFAATKSIKNSINWS